MATENETKRRSTRNKERMHPHGDNYGDNQPLHFLSVRVSNPHSQTYDRRGEDASVQTNRAIGVFDGVGSWKDDGVDVSRYTRSLARHTNHALMGEKGRTIRGAWDAVYYGMKTTDKPGTSTACVAGMDGKSEGGTDVSTGRTLKGINIGDSGLIVIRGGHIVYKTKEQSKSFNHPHQIGYREREDFSRGQRINFDLKEEDVVLVMTDGILDNVYKKDILHIVNKHTERWNSGRYHDMRNGFKEKENYGKITSAVKSRFTEFKNEISGIDRKHAGLPEQILEMAMEIMRRAYRGAHDSNWESPFAKKANTEDFDSTYGGKVDDMTLVIGFVTSSRMTSQIRVAIDCPRCPAHSR